MANFKKMLSKLFSGNIRYAFKSAIQIHASKLKRTSIKLDASNTVNLRNANLRKCKIRVKGQNNEITILGTLSECNIDISGSNNKLTIGSECRFTGAKFIINGVKCEISIDDESTAIFFMAVCMGKHNYIHIGKGCMFADYVDLWASDTHPIQDEEGNLLNPSKPIVIGNHVWIGRHTKILKGVSIGEGSVIGMSSLVTKNILPHTLNAGVPAKCIKQGINWQRDFIIE